MEFCSVQIPLAHCGPSSWDNVKVADSTNSKLVKREKLKGLLLAELKEVSNRELLELSIAHT